jgi:adenosyl cobinamide kinase/adenosyl cobinamide phosphate guanylyltransferase
LRRVQTTYERSQRAHDKVIRLISTRRCGSMEDCETLTFITGGAYQGKLRYARSIYAPHPVAVIEGDAIPEKWFSLSQDPQGVSDIGTIRLLSSEGKHGECEADGNAFDTVIVNHVERIVGTIRTLSMTPEESLENLLANFKRSNRVRRLIFIADEVGSGVVPLGEEARRDRDDAGRLAVACASKASRVVHVLAGVPLIIK